jgi:hypothetical protein
MKNSARMIGLDDLEDVLNSITPKHANNLMRATVNGIAGEVRKEIKIRAPQLTGTLKSSIKVKRKRSTPEKPISQVLGNVGGYKYWFMLEHGTGGDNPIKGTGFVRKSKEKILSMLPKIVLKQFGKKLEASLKKQRKKIASGNFT